MIKTPILFLLILLTAPPTYASEDTPRPALPVERVDANRAIQMEAITRTILEIENDIKSVQARLKINSNKDDIESLRTLLEELEDRLMNQYSSFEQLATGTVDLSLFRPLSEREFSWQTELKDVFKPLLFELKKLTERPRQIEKLRSQSETLESKISSASNAIEQIEQAQKSIEFQGAKKLLKSTYDEWLLKRDDLINQKSIIDFQLEEKLQSDELKSTQVINAIRDFFTGRGASFLLGVIAFTLTFIVVRYLGFLIEKKLYRGTEKDARFLSRLAHLTFRVLTVLFSVLALMATLYALSDWLLLTLFLLIFVGFAFALRNSLPKYIDEVRLLLNMGSVREGERLIYSGLPWRVSRINIHTDLVNPLLTGGRIRLPISKMLGLVSRRWSRNEPWFPCKPEQYVILDDGTFGKVELQTPEIVQLGVLGGTLKTYPTTTFLSAKPRNLSEGFTIFVSFGVDYALQKDINQKVRGLFEGHVRKSLEESKFGKHIIETTVEFEEAGASALILKIKVELSGDAAGHYYPLKRLIHAYAVDACNEYDWVIPFNQLTLTGSLSNTKT